LKHNPRKGLLPKELKPINPKDTVKVDNAEIPKVEHARDLLPIVLKDKKARTKFLNGEVSFEEAVEITKGRHPETTSSFYNKLKRATEALENAEVLRIKQAVENDADKKYILKNLCQTVNKFCRAIGLEVPQANAKKKRQSP